jgi:RNA polymerase sigma-70 factor (ECF subfamily)
MIDSLMIMIVSIMAKLRRRRFGCGKTGGRWGISLARIWHSIRVMWALADSSPTMPKPPPPPSFEHLYSTHLDYVRRKVRRLGVADEAVDDVTQQVFLAVHRRLEDFVEVRKASTWISAIVVRAVRFYHRTVRRKSPHLFAPAGDPETLADSRVPEPHDALLRAENARLVRRWVDELDHKKRQVLILSELDELSAVEIAKVTSVNVNTVNSRLRAARRDLARAARRHHFAKQSGL